MALSSRFLHGGAGRHHFGADQVGHAFVDPVGQLGLGFVAVDEAVAGFVDEHLAEVVGIVAAVTGDIRPRRCRTQVAQAVDVRERAKRLRASGNNRSSNASNCSVRQERENRRLAAEPDFVVAAARRTAGTSIRTSCRARRCMGQLARPACSRRTGSAPSRTARHRERARRPLSPSRAIWRGRRRALCRFRSSGQGSTSRVFSLAIHCCVQRRVWLWRRNRAAVRRAAARSRGLSAWDGSAHCGI